jgi:hypothetical protein
MVKTGTEWRVKTHASQMCLHCLCHVDGDAGQRGDLFGRRSANRFNRAKVLEERLAASRADAGHPVQLRGW